MLWHLCTVRLSLLLLLLMLSLLLLSLLMLRLLLRLLQGNGQAPLREGTPVRGSRGGRVCALLTVGCTPLPLPVPLSSVGTIYRRPESLTRTTTTTTTTRCRAWAFLAVLWVGLGVPLCCLPGMHGITPRGTRRLAASTRHTRGALGAPHGACLWRGVLGRARAEGNPPCG